MNTFKSLILFIVTFILIGCSTEPSITQVDLLLDEKWQLIDYTLHDTNDDGIVVGNVTPGQIDITFESENQLRIKTQYCGEITSDVRFENDNIIYLSNREFITRPENGQNCSLTSLRTAKPDALIEYYMYPSNTQASIPIRGVFEVHNHELTIYFDREEQNTLNSMGPVTFTFN